jgi:7-carboxy-7-deazaguanine synthase
MFINSIYAGINGEVSILGQGSLCTFIRLQGCNLKCKYCDTKQAQKVDKEKTEFLSTDKIYTHIINGYDDICIFPRNITITGGEPLTQEKEVLALARMIKMYSENHYTISIETNGSFRVPYSEYVDSWVVDWKAPSSGMRDKMKHANFLTIGRNDFVKFTIKDKDDFIDATDCMEQLYKGFESSMFAFSPQVSDWSGNDIDKKILIDWMLHSKICVETKAILNLQIHKIIGTA